MIRFKFHSKQPIPKDFPKEYPEVLKYEGDFLIEIDNKLYFHEPNFSIFEFLIYIDKWEIDNNDMHYICIDTDENPLISFLKCGEK